MKACVHGPRPHRHLCAASSDGPAHPRGQHWTLLRSVSLPCCCPCPLPLALHCPGVLESCDRRPTEAQLISAPPSSEHQIFSPKGQATLQAPTRQNAPLRAKCPRACCLGKCPESEQTTCGHPTARCWYWRGLNPKVAAAPSRDEPGCSDPGGSGLCCGAGQRGPDSHHALKGLEGLGGGLQHGPAFHNSACWKPSPRLLLPPDLPRGRGGCPGD